MSLADALKPLASKLVLAFVYGSIASGEERSDSDIDLLVVGTALPAALAVPLRDAREILGREINPTVYSPTEFARKRAAKDHFLARVLAKPKLLVLGSEDELAKLLISNRVTQQPSTKAELDSLRSIVARCSVT